MSEQIPNLPLTSGFIDFDDLFPEAELTVVLAMNFWRSFDDDGLFGLAGFGFELKVVHHTRVLHTFDIRRVANRVGTVGLADVAMHIHGSERFIVVQGIGRHNDICYMMHLKKVGSNWRFDGDSADNLGDRGCGRIGLNTRVTFTNGVGLIRFWVGDNADHPCRLEVKFKDGEFKKTHLPTI